MHISCSYTPVDLPSPIRIDRNSSLANLIPIVDRVVKEQATVRVKEGFYSKGIRGNRNSAFLNATKQPNAKQTNGTKGRVSPSTIHLQTMQRSGSTFEATGVFKHKSPSPNKKQQHGQNNDIILCLNDELPEDVRKSLGSVPASNSNSMPDLAY